MTICNNVKCISKPFILDGISKIQTIGHVFSLKFQVISDPTVRLWTPMSSSSSLDWLWASKMPLLNPLTTWHMNSASSKRWNREAELRMNQSQEKKGFDQSLSTSQNHGLAVDHLGFTSNLISRQGDSNFCFSKNFFFY